VRQYCHDPRAGVDQRHPSPELAALVPRPAAGPAPTTAMSYPGSVCEVGTARSQLCADLVSRLRLDQHADVGPIVDRDRQSKHTPMPPEQAAGRSCTGFGATRDDSSNERRGHSLTGLRLIAGRRSGTGRQCRSRCLDLLESVWRNGVRSRSSASRRWTARPTHRFPWTTRAGTLMTASMNQPCAVVRPDHWEVVGAVRAKTKVAAQ